MARRRKSVNDIESQVRRIEQAGGSRAARARAIGNRYIENIYNTRSMQRAVARSGQTNASGNTTDYEAIQMNRPYAQDTYTGRRAPVSNSEAARQNARRRVYDNQGRRVGPYTPAGNIRNRGTLTSARRGSTRMFTRNFTRSRGSSVNDASKGSNAG